MFTRTKCLPIKKKLGFTLAEILITLGIIGVVLAITIPTLFANTNSLKYRGQYKKVLSFTNQAVRLNIALYDFDFSSANEQCSIATDNPETKRSICALFNGSLSGHTIFNHRTLKTKGGRLYYQDLYSKGTTVDTLIKEYGVDLFYYQFKDGSLFAFHSPTVNCTLGNNTIENLIKNANFQRYCVGWIDVNGINPPNKEVRCEDGKSHSKDIEAPCVVSDKYITDVFPVVFYDSTIAPASAASRYVLNSTK